MQMVVPRPCDGKEKKVSLSLFRSVHSPFPSDARIMLSFSLFLSLSIATVYQSGEKKGGRGEGIMYRNQMINY